MKICPWCGRKNTDDRQTCLECETVLTASGNPASDPLRGKFFSEQEKLDVSAIEMGYDFVEGFSRPDWKHIRKSIESLIPEDQRSQAWREVARQWLAQLRDDIGGNYRYAESNKFLLLSAVSKADQDAVLKTAENGLAAIESFLGPVSLTARVPINGKRVILAFDEEADYYAYISYFYPEGNHSHSAGCFINKYYGHIVFKFRDALNTRRTLIHELTHNSLWGLKLPTWLNEGLCRKMERNVVRAVTKYGMVPVRTILNADLADEHHDYWNEQNIQEFWAGTSFYRPDARNSLSYSLGEILVELISENWGSFIDFVGSADYRDGGEDAALKYLNKSLGDVAATFLGEGNWRPNKQLWDARQTGENGE